MPHFAVSNQGYFVRVCKLQDLKIRMSGQNLDPPGLPLVNLERVAKIEAYTKDGRIAVLRNGTQLPVRRAGYARLKVLLGES